MIIGKKVKQLESLVGCISPPLMKNFCHDATKLVCKQGLGWSFKQFLSKKQLCVS